MPDVLIGTSAGALNGAAIATSPTLEKVDHLEKVWVSLDGDDVFPGGTLRRAWNILRRDDHLIPNRGLRRRHRTGRGRTHLHRPQLPLRVVTTDLMTGDEIVIVERRAAAGAARERGAARGSSRRCRSTGTSSSTARS